MKKMKYYFIYIFIVLILIFYIKRNTCIRELEETEIISKQNDTDKTTDFKGQKNFNENSK